MPEDPPPVGPSPCRIPLVDDQVDHLEDRSEARRALGPVRDLAGARSNRALDATLDDAQARRFAASGG